MRRRKRKNGPERASARKDTSLEPVRPRIAYRPTASQRDSFRRGQCPRRSGAFQRRMRILVGFDPVERFPGCPGMIDLIEVETGPEGWSVLEGRLLVDEVLRFSPVGS